MNPAADTREDACPKPQDGLGARWSLTWWLLGEQPIH